MPFLIGILPIFRWRFGTKNMMDMRFHSLKPSPNKGDRLIEGYSITLDGHLFHIFVMEEMTRTMRGYILKLMYEWGDSTTVDLDRHRARYPQTTELMRRHLPEAWVNKGKTRHCYKYIVFGHGEFNRDLALALLRHMVEEVEEGGVQ